MEGVILNSVQTTAENYYLNVMRKSKTNFFYSTLFLKKQNREALRIVYAFCRMTDDIVDNANHASEEKMKNLSEWETKLKESLSGNLRDPFFDLLKKNIELFNIPSGPFFDLIRGMRMDLEKTEYRTFEELYEYCYCAASSVGLMSIEIFGYEDDDTRKFAEYLGVALQLTNIIRDIRKDAAAGRIYLPSEDMERFGYTAGDLKNFRYTGNFIELLKFECARAREYYNLAGEHLSVKDRKNMAAALMMERIYFLLLENIEKSNYDVFGNAIRISGFRKFTAVFSVFLKHKLFNTFS